MTDGLSAILGRVHLETSAPFDYLKTVTSWPKAGLVLVSGQPETHCASQHNSLVILRNVIPVEMERKDILGHRKAQLFQPSVIVHAPRVSHEIALLSEGRFLNLFVNNSNLDAIIGSDRGMPLNERSQFPPSPDFFVQQLLQTLLADAEAGHPVGLLLGETIIAAIVNRVWGTMRPSLHGRNGLAPRQLRSIRAYIEENLGSQLTLDRMAAEVGLSVRHFCRAFRVSTGSSPHQFVVRERVQRACQLLRASHEDLPTIAEICGFSSSGQMATTFKRILDAHPSQIRHTSRGLVKIQRIDGRL